jgi:hypothetical protein
MAKKSIWFLLLFLMGAACLDEPDCFRLNNYMVGISFKKLSDSSQDTARFIAIGIKAPPIGVNQDTISKIDLPLNYFENETTFMFEGPETTDSLTLGYTSQVQLVSEKCGERFVLSNLHVLSHSFDSVRLISRDPVKNGGTTHLEIFQ